MNLLDQAAQPAVPEYREIPLTQGQVAIVSPEDYDGLSAHNWCATWNKTAKTFYALRAVRSAGGKRTTVLMHRVILSPPSGQDVDHKDGDGLNNTRRNLRIASRAENLRNTSVRRDSTSGVKGATFHKNRNKWQARIRIDGKSISLGYFSSPEAAGTVYNKAAQRMFGAFARVVPPVTARNDLTATGRTEPVRKVRQAIQPQGQTYRIIPLTQGQVAKVDAGDFLAMSQFNWYANWDARTKTFYARRNIRLPGGKRSGINIHQQIVGAVSAGKVIDHRDGDGLNNRRENLRIATWQQNASNRPVYANNKSGHKGVSIASPGKWLASIGHAGNQVYLGVFDTAEAASAAYIEAARLLHGEFANW